MEVLSVIFTVLYMLLGFGYSKTIKATNSSIGKNTGTWAVTLLIWPLLLLITAFNDNMFLE